MGKICTKCKIEEEMVEFSQDKNRKDGRYPLCKTCLQQYRLEHKIAIKLQRKKYFDKNKEQINHKSSENYYKVKMIVFNHYGNICNMCKCSDMDCLTIDHINGGGCKHKNGAYALYYWLIQNNFPTDFQILCSNCQRIKVLENQECYKKDNPSDEIKQKRERYRRENLKSKINAISQYSNGKCCCSICNITDIRTLELDHINNDGAAHRRILNNDITRKGRRSGTAFYQKLKSRNYPNNPPLQVLCANCNHKKTKG